MNLPPIRTPGTDPISNHPVAPQVDATREELPCPGDGEQHGCVEDVGADDLRRREGERDQHHQPNSVPLPTDVRPTTNPPTTPVATAITRSRFVRMKGLSSGTEWR